MTSVDPRLGPPAPFHDTDVLLRDHRLPLVCVRRVEDVRVHPSGVTLACSTVRIERRMRDRYGTSLEVGEDSGPGAPVTVRFDAVTPHVLRLRMTAAADVPDNHTPMLAVDEVPRAAVTVDGTDGRLVVTTGALTLTVQRDPFRYEIRDAAGTVLRATIPAAVYQRPPTGESHLGGDTLSDAWPWFFRDQAPLGFVTDPATGATQCFETAFLGQDEHLYGFGERFGGLDKRGQAIHLWHANAAGNTWPLSYKNVPFFLSTRGYGHFTNASRPVTYHLGDLSHVHHSVHVQADLLDTFLVAGPDLRDVLARYTALTGVPAVPPTWTFGLWMSRMSYREQGEVEQVAQGLREHGVPCDVLHIDTDWFATEWVNDLTFSPDRFPDPAAMLARLRELGLRVSLWQLPYISTRSRFYDVCARRGWFATGADGRPRLIDGFFGPAGVLDFSNPEAAAWYTGHLLPLFAMGVAAIKTDFGEGAPVDARWHGTDGLSMHNLYPLLYNRAVFERTVQATGEPVIWGRSAYAGSQRYPVYWGGDPAARWEDLGVLLNGGLGLGLCGFPYWSQDIGGFAGTPSAELYIRWAQVGLFMTHPRAHGPVAREPWAFGAQALAVFRRYARLRYRLLPYLVSEALDLAPKGQPVMRALLLDHQDDPSTFTVGDQFLLGRDLLVAPVLTPGTRRRVYLPAGRWVRWDHATGGTAEVHTGPRWVTVEAPLEELPLFLPEGALLPLVAPAAHTGQIRYDEVELHVVPGTDRRAVLRRHDGQEVAMAVRGGSARADGTVTGGVRLDLDPGVRWSVVVHGLAAAPGTVVCRPGGEIPAAPAGGGAVRIDCPPATTSVEFEIPEG